MRLKLFSSSRSQIAPQPPSPASTTTTKHIETTAQHPLSQTHKRSKPQGAAKTSTQAFLASARKSFESLRKQLPSMHMSSSALRPTRTSAAPRPYVTQVATPARPPQRHGAQPVVDARRQQPAPQATGPARIKGPEPQRTASISRPAPIKQAPIRIVSPPQARQRRSLQSLNEEIALLDKRCSEISKRLFMDDGEATEQEQRLFDLRTDLIAQRNQIRDSQPPSRQTDHRQLDATLHALAPLEHVRAPRTTTSRLAMVQSEVIRSNRNALLEARRRLGNTSDLARHHDLARRHLAKLRASGADPGQVKRLERMMQGYENLLELEDIVKRTDDQLERMGGPRLMDSIPTTPQERRQRHRDELDAHQEAIDNGYL
ncbi:type III secretions system protein XopR [Xanthomonas hortorum]|uniref:Type III secretions system protein XopR n=1 Tax=Xanthomonas hortorum pv. hederae TaxID=453603 RepID=A0A9X4BQS9_9XANT|nr:type III secretions system protein XopR [Xanthomonas hortorum]MCE4370438.1 type III secretions system protein XopR [Xanthomonas hortorum pv. hederae]MDC8637395.1 type III secretions system protein XopR [Xanthomonas hortorum pv. hederae]PPU84520.1 type III secretions system protein XopR [Xanthomonas hortorum pv. hederae]PUF00955.1 type III secretions system protein XopR [Xanthomonas hortorum pv. hederae]